MDLYFLYVRYWSNGLSGQHGEAQLGGNDMFCKIAKWWMACLHICQSILLLFLILMASDLVNVVSGVGKRTCY